MAQNGLGQWAVLGKLDTAIRTGQAQGKAALGCDLYDYYAKPENVAEGKAYRDGLTGLNKLLTAELVRAIDANKISAGLDVGGSTGSMVLALMEANSTLQGASLYLPSVAEAAVKEAAAKNMSDRFTFIPGDFFASVPTTDLYVLKFVLGNWSDAEALKILRNCRASARPESRLVVIDSVLDTANPNLFTLDVDLVTMVALGGQTRTVEDYARLLKDAGFQLGEVRGTSRALSVFEAGCI